MANADLNWRDIKFYVADFSPSSSASYNGYRNYDFNWSRGVVIPEETKETKPESLPKEPEPIPEGWE